MSVVQMKMSTMMNPKVNREQKEEKDRPQSPLSESNQVLHLLTWNLSNSGQRNLDLVCSYMYEMNVDVFVLTEPGKICLDVLNDYDYVLFSLDSCLELFVFVFIVVLHSMSIHRPFELTLLAEPSNLTSIFPTTKPQFLYALLVFISLQASNSQLWIHQLLCSLLNCNSSSCLRTALPPTYPPLCLATSILLHNLLIASLAHLPIRISPSFPHYNHSSINFMMLTCYCIQMTHLIKA